MKKLAYSVFGIGFTTLASLGGCATSTSSVQTADTSAVDAFTTSSAQAECDWEYRCCNDGEIKTLVGTKYASKTECLPYQQLSQEDALYLDRLAVKEGRLRVDSVHAAACLKLVQGRACNPMAGAPPLTPSTATDCEHVFVGNTPVGGECIYANECVSGAHCVSDTAAVGHGVCVPFQKVGEICNGNADCDPNVTDIYCAKQDFKCHVRAKSGEACAYSTDTPPTLPMLLECATTATSHVYCDPSSKTCSDLPGDGQSCLTTPLPPGVSSRCNPDPTLMLVCDSGGTCRAPGKEGADCSTVPCAAQLYCATSGGSRTCTALPTLGGQCQNTNYQCAKPYFCNTTTFPYVCAQPASLGQACTGVGCDTGLYCDTAMPPATCKAQLPDGSLCTNSLECTSLLCAGTCQPRTVIAACSGR